eukprot:365545-Chlamydomonas_euryale.AAC.4
MLNSKDSCGRWLRGTIEVNKGPPERSKSFWDVQLCNSGMPRGRLQWWHHSSGHSQVDWPHKMYPLARGSSSGGGKCLGQAWQNAI